LNIFFTLCHSLILGISFTILLKRNYNTHRVIRALFIKYFSERKLFTRLANQPFDTKIGTCLQRHGDVLVHRCAILLNHKHRPRLN
jgi:hypothetical protein